MSRNGQLDLPLASPPPSCACPRRDAQGCADARHPGSLQRRLETGEDAEPCGCGCHDEQDEDEDDPLPW